jgi:hypothetical protein
MMVIEVPGRRPGNTGRSSSRCNRHAAVDSHFGVMADDGIRAGFSADAHVGGRVTVDFDVRLTKSKNENKGTIINCADESTCFEVISVLTGGASQLPASQLFASSPKLVGINV